MSTVPSVLNRKNNIYDLAQIDYWAYLVIAVKIIIISHLDLNDSIYVFLSVSNE